MLNLQETIALNNLEHAIDNAKEIGCSTNNNDCSSCPFRCDGENGIGFSCAIMKMEHILNYLNSNRE